MKDDPFINWLNSTKFNAYSNLTIEMMRLAFNVGKESRDVELAHAHREINALQLRLNRLRIGLRELIHNAFLLE